MNTELIGKDIVKHRFAGVRKIGRKDRRYTQEDHG